MHTKTDRFLSYILSLILFIGCFSGISAKVALAEPFVQPIPVSERSAPPSSEELGFIEDPIDKTNLNEDFSLRTVNSKTYRNKDAMNLVAVYDTDVHYKDGNSWKKINNTLTDGPVIDGTGTLTNQANDFSVKFAKNTKANFIGMVQKNNYSVKWSLAGSKESSVKKIQSSGEEKEFAWDLEGIQSSVRYTGILPSTDLEYVVDGSDVKENLVINEPTGKSDFWNQDVVRVLDYE